MLSSRFIHGARNDKISLFFMVWDFHGGYMKHFHCLLSSWQILSVIPDLGYCEEYVQMAQKMSLQHMDFMSLDIYLV